MCSSAISTVTDPFKPVAKVTGLDSIPRKLIGEPFKKAKNDLLGTGEIKPLGALETSTRTPLAIGTQTGGTRQSLGK